MFTHGLFVAPPTSGLLCSIENDNEPSAGGSLPENPEAPSMEAFTRMVNSAVSSQLARKLPQAISAALGPALAPLQEQLSTLTTSPSEPQGGGNDSDSSDLANQVKALQQQVKEEREARARETERHREAQVNSRLRDALTSKGVRRELIDGAVATVRDRVVVRDDGVILWRAQRQGYHEDLDLDAGVSEWASTDIGKAHLAPRDAQGSGQGRPGAGGGPRPGPMPMDPKAAARQRRLEARRVLFHGMGQMVAGGGSVPLTGGNTAKRE